MSKNRGGKNQSSKSHAPGRASGGPKRGGPNRESRQDGRPARNASSGPGRGPSHSSGHSSGYSASHRANHRGAIAKSHAGRQQSRPERDTARWVVGIHSCEETLKVRPRTIREIWLRDDFQSSQSLRDLAEAAERNRISVKTKSAGQLDAVGSGHQGVALAVTESPEVDWSKLKEPGPCVVIILDGIEDPHNLGSMLRTSWLTDAKAIFIPEDRAVGLTPSVCKIASGGAEHVPVEAHSNLTSLIQDLKDRGFWIYGLAESGTKRPWDLKLSEKVAWVIGSEGSGMRITTERACDELVRIPQVDTGSSYNASIALSMVLAETCRQFGNPR